MNNHVPTLETCQKLKAAGFPQEPEYHWANFYRHYEYDDLLLPIVRYFQDGSFSLEKMTYGEDSLMEDAMEDSQGAISYAAPLLTEILEQLPRSIEVDGVWGYFLRIEPMIPSSNWRFNYSHMKPIEAIHKNPAEAAALLWLELNAA